MFMIVLIVLAVPTVGFLVWLGGVFVREYVRVSRGGDRHDAAVAGLVPAERQDTALAAPLPAAERAALDAVREGRWEPAAAVLTEIGRDWERRSAFTYLLGELAADDDTWLTAWEQTRRDCPDAAVVRARSTVVLAWNVRGAKRARYTSREQFEGFHRVLEQAGADIERAAQLNPDDPTPHIAAIWVALGLGAPRAEMDRIWAEVTARAPHHYEAHFSALQYWCKKWRGSRRLAMAFAEQAAAAAPAGSLLTAFPLIAFFEHDGEDAEGTDEPEDVESEAMQRRVDAALRDVAAADASHPRLAEVRHLLAYYCLLQGRVDESAENFRLVDGYVGALPWRYRGDDQAEHFCDMRDIALKGAADVAFHLDGAPPQA
ncbi:hypothetical protein LG634_33900 [Streptomyces bambusae]|uniref:hypothetical protein n=1 Tax=Streptomyces bambusae TaxID=1550616 RepID=UPI001CFFEA77|nr:hypothetical protein [Streptomyces bambusae]MCB5169782.1 hypothetical protein [Streptomyces bambusae]